MSDGNYLVQCEALDRRPDSQPMILAAVTEPEEPSFSFRLVYRGQRGVELRRAVKGESPVDG